MSKKYRLVRTDPGVLDLSQVLDDAGRPVVLKNTGDAAVVNEATTKHPLVRRFIGAGLKVEEVSLTPVQAPATPVVDKVTAPPKPPPTPAPAPKPAPVTATPVKPQVKPIVPDTKPVKEPAPVETVLDKPVEDAPEKTEDETDKKPRSTKKSSRRKYGK
jgi:hypothetical protein